MPILRDWTKYYYIEEYNDFCLIGKVYNDSRFPDGSEIRTSEVLEINGVIAKTKNTKYILE